MIMKFFFSFFFKQKTAYEMRISDWSSDVCSSDLANRRMRRAPIPRARLPDLFLSGANFRHLLSDGFAGAAANPLGVVPVVTVGPTGVAGAGVVMIAGGGAYFASHAITSA